MEVTRPLLSWVSDFDSSSESKSEWAATELAAVLSQKFKLRLYARKAGMFAQNGTRLSVSAIDDFKLIESQSPADFLLIQAEDGEHGVLENSFGLSGKRACVWFHDYYSRAGSNLLERFRENLSGLTCAVFSSERDVGEARRNSAILNNAESLLLQYLPYPVSSAAAVADATDCRIICASGVLVEDQVHSLLRALETSDCGVELVWCVGEAERAAAQMMAAEHANVAVRFEERSARRWKELLSPGVVAVHLHTSAIGDAGPYLAQSLVSGAAVIVSDYSAGALLPDSAAIKILPGNKQVESLSAALKSLFDAENGRSLREELSAAATEYGRECHSSAAIAAELCSLFDSLAV